MAKHPAPAPAAEQAAPPATPASALLDIGGPLTVSFGESTVGHAFTVDIFTLPIASVRYLLSHGFGKSLQDTIGGVGPVALAAVRASLADERITEGEHAGKPTPAAELGSKLRAEHPGLDPEAIAKAVVRAKMQARVDKIVAGTMGETSERGPRGPKTGTLDFYARQYAIELLKAHAAKLGAKMATGDDLAAQVRRVIEGKSAEKVRAEAERRLAASTALAEGDDSPF